MKKTKPFWNLDSELNTILRHSCHYKWKSTFAIKKNMEVFHFHMTIIETKKNN